MKIKITKLLTLAFASIMLFTGCNIQSSNSNTSSNTTSTSSNLSDNTKTNSNSSSSSDNSYVNNSSSLVDNISITNEELSQSTSGSLYDYNAEVRNNNSVDVAIYYNIAMFNSSGVQLDTNYVRSVIPANTTAKVYSGFYSPNDVGVRVKHYGLKVS